MCDVSLSSPPSARAPPARLTPVRLGAAQEYVQLLNCEWNPTQLKRTRNQTCKRVLLEQSPIPTEGSQVVVDLTSTQTCEPEASKDLLLNEVQLPFLPLAQPIPIPLSVNVEESEEYAGHGDTDCIDLSQNETGYFPARPLPTLATSSGFNSSRPNHSDNEPLSASSVLKHGEPRRHTTLAHCYN